MWRYKTMLNVKWTHNITNQKILRRPGEKVTFKGRFRSKKKWKSVGRPRLDHTSQTIKLKRNETSVKPVSGLIT